MEELFISDKHNEQNRPTNFEEEVQFISEVYAERLNKTDNPVSGEELYTKTMQNVNELLKIESFKR